MHGTINIKLTAYSCICWLFHRIYYDARNYKHKKLYLLQYLNLSRAIKNLLRIPCQPEVHGSVHTSPTLNFILSHMNPIHAFTPSIPSPPLLAVHKTLPPIFLALPTQNSVGISLPYRSGLNAAPLRTPHMTLVKIFMSPRICSCG